MKLKILTFNWHEPYLCLLSRLKHDFLVVEPEIAPGHLRRWDQNMRSVPDNLTLISMAIAHKNLEEGEIYVLPKNEKDKSNPIWGTTRAHVSNIVKGVSEGFSKTLELNGVGFRANLKGKELNFQIGLSHDVKYMIPDGIKIVVEKSTVIKISGIDKELVGKVSSEIKKLKPVEPYKGKGIKERGQYVLRKEGKKK